MQINRTCSAWNKSRSTDTPIDGEGDLPAHKGEPGAELSKSVLEAFSKGSSNHLLAGSLSEVQASKT